MFNCTCLSDVAQTIRLAKMLSALGVNLLDISLGENHMDQKITFFNDFQIGITGGYGRRCGRA